MLQAHPAQGSDSDGAIAWRELIWGQSVGVSQGAIPARRLVTACGPCSAAIGQATVAASAISTAHLISLLSRRHSAGQL